MKVIKKYLFAALCCLLSGLLPFSLAGQEPKREVEKSIKREEMPEEALELLEPLLEDARKLKFYYETHPDKTSYEAKFRWEGRPLSIEFYNDGRLMDIEELIPMKDVKKETRQTIDQYFEENFSRYRVKRVQRQFTAEEREEEGEEVLEEFRENDWEDLRVRYEIIAQVKNENILGTYEFLFNDQGRLINKQRVIRRSANNILY